MGFCESGADLSRELNPTKYQHLARYSPQSGAFSGLGLRQDIASRVTRALTRQSDALVRSAGRSRKRLGEPNAPDRSPRARSGLLSSSGLRSASRTFIGPHTPRCLPTPASETGEGIGTGLFSAGPGTIFAAPRYPTGGILDSPPRHRRAARPQGTILSGKVPGVSALRQRVR